jgi:hypothetical protein
MRVIWAVCATMFWTVPVLAQQTATVERVADGYVFRTRDRFPNGTTGTGELRLPSVPGLLQGFVADAKNPSPHNERNDLTVLSHRGLFPRATVDSLLAGYEALAVDPTQDARVASAAIVAIGTAGSSQEAHPMPGQTARLLRIYRAAGDRARRYGVVSQLGNATDRPAAVAFLRGIATLPPSDETDQLAVASIRSLALLGDEGAAALRELHRTDAVRVPEARFAVEAFARRGYRARP